VSAALVSPLTVAERACLRLTLTGEGWYLRDGKTSPRIQSLISRGYCRTSPKRSGPLGIRTGEVCITVTEAGRFVLGHTALEEVHQAEQGKET
jgi:hypothetical protein